MFYTNASEFSFKEKGTGQIGSVTRSDVNLEGKIRDEEMEETLLGFLGIQLREGVKIRFIFASKF